MILSSCGILLRTKTVIAVLCTLLLAGCSAQARQAGDVPPTPDKSLAKGDFVYVDKSDRLLFVFKDGREVARFQNIRFGDAPQGHKQFEGDEKTPEGDYVIDSRNPASRYHLSLHINYPNKADSDYAAAKGKSPGGDIFIHGQPNGYDGPAIARDWTDGCIALSNSEIEKLWSMIANGTKIRIAP